MALGFAIDHSKKALEKDNAPGQESLLVEILINGNQNYFYLNTKEYTSYPVEQEVLLQDGLRYRVVSVSEVMETIKSEGKDAKEYQKKLTVVQL